MESQPTPTLSSSSSLFTVTTESTSLLTPDITNTYVAIQSPKPKLSLNISLASPHIVYPAAPKMSAKGFIEPHIGHLPRRTRPSSQKSERQRFTAPTVQLVSDHRQKHHATAPEPTPETKPLPPSQLTVPRVTTHPHRDNLPRRNSVHRRAKTAPTSNHTQPLPISVVDSQSTMVGGQAPTPIYTSPMQDEQPQNPPETSDELPILKLNPKALSLISKAQEKAFRHRPPHLQIDGPSSSSPSSPQLPHPAMGLTMGIMEAYARDVNEDGANARPVHSIVKTGLAYSPAVGIKGTPAMTSLNSAKLPSRVPILGSVPASAPILASNSIPITTPATHPQATFDPPVTAPLGRNLPRRHQHRRRASPPQPSVEEPGVLGFERGRVVSAKGHRGEGIEEEDGLFSSYLDFEHPRKPGEERSCVQVIGRSCVEVGYMRESEVEERGDIVLLEVQNVDVRHGQRNQRLELKLPDNAGICKEGTPSLLPEQVRAACEFMKWWLGHKETKRKVRISAARWRASDAFGLAICFLSWVEEERTRRKEDKWIVPLETDPIEDEKYTLMHRLYMRILDDEQEEEEEEEEEEGLAVGDPGEFCLGIDPGSEGGSSCHSDSTTGCSRPTVMRVGEGKRFRARHIREAALGGLGITLLPSSSSSRTSSTSSDVGRVHRNEWRGLGDEWRGVLSFEGLNTLVGVWP